MSSDPTPRESRNPMADEKFEVDVAERSVPRGGQPQVLDQRLFMQLQVFTGCGDPQAAVAAVRQSGLPCVLYSDVNDPYGIGFLSWSQDPGHFVTRVRGLLGAEPFADLLLRSEFTMLGRTYSSGYEPDLEDWLLRKPRRTATQPEMPWAVWYPLRRTGSFSALPPAEQRSILAEHAKIGFAYGQKGLLLDIRLACHGLDAADNEFVIGVVGKDLHPISHLIQTMRRSRQTVEYVQSMGPFFVGHVLHAQDSD